MKNAIRTLLPLLAAVVGLAQAPAVPSVIRVGGNVQAANLVTKVAPEYPAAMKAQKLEATVALSVLIDAKGVPVSMSVVDPSVPREFVDSAIEAVKQWRYKPTLLNGQPVEVMTTIQVSFTLAQ
jgi:TonB family protein